MHPWLFATERTVAASGEAVHVVAAGKMVSNNKYEQPLLSHTKKIESKRRLQCARAKAGVDPHEQIGGERIGTGDGAQPKQPAAMTLCD